jgi:hypothetical protein
MLTLCKTRKILTCPLRLCPDKGWCEKSAASCSVIQRVLEHSPQLTFVNGEFRHVYSSVGPSPPPPPLPPPRTQCIQTTL